MRLRRLHLALAALLLFSSTALGQNAVKTGSKLDYPATKKVVQVDDFHGTKISDPYRWLEDLDSADTRAWVEAQNRLTFGYLAEIPQRSAMKERLTKLWNFERFGVPFREGGRYFYTRNSGLQNQSVLYTVESLDAPPRVLLDPNALSADGTVALAGYDVTDDGRLIAYGLAASGSDWNELRVRDVATGKDLADVIKWVKFSNISWAKDGKGFFYSRYDEPAGGSTLAAKNEFHKLYFHRLGTPQSEDALVYKSDRAEEKDFIFIGQVTDDGRYLIITAYPGASAENRVYYKDLTRPDAPVVKLLDDPGVAQYFLGSDGPLFWFQTDRDAPLKRIVEIDTRKPARKDWRVVVPEAKESMDSVGVVADQFIVSYLKDAYTQVNVFDRAGKFVRKVEMPGIGSAFGFGGKRADRETFYAFTSYTVPTTIYRYDAATGASTVFKRPAVDFRTADYETKQVFYRSKDGTRVPMFITHRKGLKLDGRNPTLLYGYGGFDSPITPGFSVGRIVWLEMGGVYVEANLRGGSEYGKAWHEAGMKAKKQNVFDDFIAAAEWLIANKYTSPPKLAINGGSNGGLLVGAAVTQRPELFGAAIADVGVMDMLRFHKFTIGSAWIPEYGSPDVAEEFRTLRAYSPLHNLKPGTKYPATLITTADHDDRVWPGHSFKFAAAMQAAQAGSAPVLIRIETKAGHGAGKPITKIIEEVTDRWAFLVRALNM